MSLKPSEFGPRVLVLNTRCTVTSYERLCSDLARHCRGKPKSALAVDFTNVHIVAMRQREEDFRAVTDPMDLFVPDSQVLTWAVNWRGGKMEDRVYGPAFLTYQIENSPPDIRHYFLGASQECLDELLRNIRKTNPKFKIVGSHNGYFGPEDEDRIAADINAAKPDLVWVGLGTPKQQEWISSNKDRIEAGALLAVGFAFDVNAGTKKDAPNWMQPIGLTWLYRLMQEPRRLWKRYLYYNSLFLKELFLQQMGFGGERIGEGRPQGGGASVCGGGAEGGQERCNVLGVGISVINLESGTRQVLAGTDRPGFQGYVTVTGVHGVMESRRDPELRRIHNQSYMSTPDGMPMVWVGRWGGHEDMDRVYGPDLMLDVVRRSAGTGRKHFFLGGAEGVAEKVGERMQTWFPGTELAGSNTPPFRPLTEKEEADLAEQIRETQPHFVWVGLGTPKQERFMHDFLSRHREMAESWDHGFLMLGVGAAFSFHVGQVRQAPHWMQDRGLEWFFRLCMEPARLWKRYSLNNTAFIFAIIAQLMGWKKYPIEK